MAPFLQVGVGLNLRADNSSLDVALDLQAARLLGSGGTPALTLVLIYTHFG
jgi:hypothetical protein